MIKQEQDETIDEEDVKSNVTERLATKREGKFNQLWKELLEKISEINQVGNEDRSHSSRDNSSLQLGMLSMIWND